MPEMLPVESSSIEAIGYDAAARTLYVKFLHSGRTYAYDAVEQTIADELMSANSKGHYVNTVIKTGYDYRLL